MYQPAHDSRAQPATTEQQHHQQQHMPTSSRVHDASPSQHAYPPARRRSISHDRPRVSHYLRLPANALGNNVTDAKHDQARSGATRVRPTAGGSTVRSVGANGNTQNTGEGQVSPTGSRISPLGYSWPILLALVPPLGSLFFGSTEAWSDFFSLVLIGIFLYHIIKVPWELYYGAAEKASATDTMGAPMPEGGTLVSDPRSEEARRSLRIQERVCLGLVLTSPVIGGGTLYFLKSSLSGCDKYFSNINILVFVLAASFRPLAHVVSLSKYRAAMLQQRAHFPYTEVGMLRQRVEALDGELASLKESVVASQKKMAEGATQAVVVPQLHEISKAVKRSERRDEFLRGYSEERFQTLEGRMREQEKALQLVVVQIAALRSMFAQQHPNAVAAAPQLLSGEDGVPKEVEPSSSVHRSRRKGGFISWALSIMASTALLPITSVTWVCAFFVHMLPSWFFVSRPKLRTLDERYLDDEGVGGLCRDQRRSMES